MTNKELDHKIKQAFSNATPDVLDSILSQCDTQKGSVIVMTDTPKTNPWFKRLAGIAAVFLLLIVGTFSFQSYQANFTVDSTVSLDVNPSIEIQINQKEKVLAVIPQNEDARIVVGDMDFKGNTLDVTVNALIGSMLRNGYLNDLANSILVSVDNQDPARGASLQAKLTEDINAMLQTNSFSGAVLSQTLSPTSELQQLADTYGITLGKAQLIQQIITQNTYYSFEDLVSLSINELNLLSESGSMNLDNIKSVGTASDKAYIGDAKAKDIALAHAGLTADDISHYKNELDYEQGAMVYEIEFKCNGYEYDYEVDAVSGTIIEHKKEVDDDYISPQSPSNANNNTSNSVNTAETNNTANNTSPSDNVPSNQDEAQGNSHHNTTSSYIGENAAKDIAVSHAGIASHDLHDYKCSLDEEDQVMVYDIDFYCDGYEYDFEINAYTGAVIKYEKEEDYDHPNYSNDISETPGSSENTNSSYIGESAAKSAALSHAGVSENTLTKFKCELDDDDGVMIYEIEFDCDGYEFEYEIDALTGAVIKYEKDQD
ncbi:MAG: hypothetical protein HFJ10_06645 [Lachnospiraceae bacterium]|jgi:uncharacterized membrane protein YkoI|nr:hypothetical protein [Lachnospiraceae bacterium]